MTTPLQTIAVGLGNRKNTNLPKPGVSIVVPVYNEYENIDKMAERLFAVIQSSEISYEIIFVDDHSTDGTRQYLYELEQNPRNKGVFRVVDKIGVRGKAFSLLQGFAEARGSIIAMIDGDLQYPPEAIPKMLRKLNARDIIVARRNIRHEPLLRKCLSRIYKFLFGRLLFGLAVDVQSGLKVFRRDVLHNLFLHPTKWGFDYEFLFKAKRMGWRIGEVRIVFSERTAGRSKINILAAFELAGGALVLRLRYLARSFFKFIDWPHRSERRPHDFANDADFLFLPEIHSAKKHLYAETLSLVVIAFIAVTGSLYAVYRIAGVSPLIALSGIIAALYFFLISFKLLMVAKSISAPLIDFSAEEIRSIRDKDLPVYTILIPLYREEKVIRQIIDAMKAIDYPPKKLDVIITLEEYDHSTINAIKEANPPAYFKTLILPDVKPKTKPKALNVALLQTKGEFLVIYDAEIVPDTDQLKKAYLAFKKHPELTALQTRLDHYNVRQSFITRLFNAEFSFYYDLFLPGLDRLGIPLPLSGHSTHFRREAIETIGAWDPYNVTEDCDLGIRMCRTGYKAAVINSTSREEATATLGAWLCQRTCWMKGFIQTSIVHLRHPLRFKREIGGWKNFFGFLFIVPGTVVINVLNLLYWGILAAWFMTGSETIQAVFPAPVLYISVFSFVVGNFIFTYLNLIGAYQRKRFDIVKYAFLSPVYWIMLAIASARAAAQIITSPHHWEKTVHGVSLPEIKLNIPMPIRLPRQIRHVMSEKAL